MAIDATTLQAKAESFLWDPNNDDAFSYPIHSIIKISQTIFPFIGPCIGFNNSWDAASSTYAHFKGLKSVAAECKTEIAEQEAAYKIWFEKFDKEFNDHVKKEKFEEFEKQKQALEAKRTVELQKLKDNYEIKKKDFEAKRTVELEKVKDKGESQGNLERKERKEQTDARPSTSFEIMQEELKPKVTEKTLLSDYELEVLYMNNTFDSAIRALEHPEKWYARKVGEVKKIHDAVIDRYRLATSFRATMMCNKAFSTISNFGWAAGLTMLTASLIAFCVYRTNSCTPIVAILTKQFAFYGGYTLAGAFLILAINDVYWLAVRKKYHEFN